MTGWGPQPTGGVAAPVIGRGGGHWVLFAVLAAFCALPINLMIGMTDAGLARADSIPNDVRAFAAGVGWFSGAVFALISFFEGKRGQQFMFGRWVSLVVLLMASWHAVGLSLIGWGLGRWRHKHGPFVRLKRSWGKTADDYREALPPGDRGYIMAHAEPLMAAMAANGRNDKKLPGAHMGWGSFGEAISANPRGAALVIGPPGSGKSSAVIIPSVLVAPGPCVSSSIKTDVMISTWKARSRLGRVWHFRPTDDEPTPPGVLECRWSPLVGVTSWDKARMMASRMAEPAMSKKGGEGDHFTERARDWLEILLYAAAVGERPISTVADWGLEPDAQNVQEEVEAELIFASGNGDGGAGIALRQHRGLLATPDKERGSIKSTLAKLLRIYGSESARRLGDAPNFDARAFVRSGERGPGSGDTLFVSAPPDKQKEYAPLIAGLLEDIRYAVYERAANIEAGREPTQPHVTFVLDEANNTAPIPLPAIVSEAGGQGLHIVVGLQDLSRARDRWGRAAEGFLTLFPTKLVLNGVVEPFTLQTLSDASGEYDRQMQGYSIGTQYLGQWHMPVQTVTPSYSTQRQRVLTQGDIAQLPQGCALLFQGASWELIRIGLHWQDPAWKAVLSHAETSHYLHTEPGQERPALPQHTTQATTPLPRQDEPLTS